ncbi:unnamed protein product [Parajaminaea phylloscopi]
MQSFASSAGKLSREEWRRQKDLDAARKAGTAPAEIGEDGEVINPHVPEYMSKAPWYMDTGKRSLKHQKKPDTGETFVGINEWYQRGQKADAPVATKYRKGACDNCGAMTHKTKDCLERPRKKGAKWSNKDIAPDEHLTDFGDKKVDFATKRDRWNGYDPSEHKRIMEEYEAVEEERRRLREEQIDKQTSTDLSEAKKIAKKTKKKSKAGEEGEEAGTAADPDFSSSDDDDDDDEKEKYAESANMAGQKVDTDNRMSIRNLRIREDRAKYLYNLDPNSAYYDPKTRSMREAPDALRRPEDSQFAGDNYNRAKGDTIAMQRLQLFAWQAEARGNDLHMQANPTVNEKQFREFQQKKEKLRESTKGSILEKYGGAQHFDSVPKELLSGQTEDYVEYSRSGKVVKGQERATAKSRFEEDVLEKNHTQVWGSWYDLSTGQWGYKCCHSTLPNSYCTGQAGIEASKASSLGALAPSAPKQEVIAENVERSSETRNGRPQTLSTETAAGHRKSRDRSASIASAGSRASGSRTTASDFSSTDASDSDDSARRDQSRKRKSRASDDRRHRSRTHRRRRRSRSAQGDTSDDGSDREDDRSRHDRRRVEGYSSKKHIGEGDVSSRLDKGKLKAALREEDRRRGSGSGRDARSDQASKKPDWLREAEAINSGAAAAALRRGGGKHPGLADEQDAEPAAVNDTEVTEEQMEAYRLKNRNDYEDPMANYRDSEASPEAATRP